MSYLISHRLTTRCQFLLRQVMRLFFTVKSTITLGQIKPINVGARFNITILLLSASELTSKLRILLNRKSWLPGTTRMIHAAVRYAGILGVYDLSLRPERWL